MWDAEIQIRVSLMQGKDLPAVILLFCLPETIFRQLLTCA